MARTKLVLHPRDRTSVVLGFGLPDPSEILSATVVIAGLSIGLRPARRSPERTLRRTRRAAPALDACGN